MMHIHFITQYGEFENIGGAFKLDKTAANQLYLVLSRDHATSAGKYIAAHIYDDV